MKTLDLKLLYTNILALSLLLPSLGGVGGGLYAQDPQLFEHTWYFHQGILDGEEFYPLIILNGELNILIDFFGVNHSFCEEGGGGSIVGFQNGSFILEDFLVVLVGVCGDPDETEFMHKHYSIYGDYDDTGIANNPFNYIIEPVDSYLQLTIENGKGDWAVYNSVLLSTPGFNESGFMVYPNPVKEILHINNTSNQAVTAAIYDINGKLLQSHILIANTSTIDVKALQTGLYFVVFENESGERVSKKFVKK